MDNMKFAGLIKQSLLDYPDKIAAVAFTYGCNLRCPFCHNGHLLIRPSLKDKGAVFITEEEVLSFLKERQGFLDALVISGGEPTLEPDLVSFVKKVKEYDFLVKIDTNGTNPDLLKILIQNRLADYIAMDIKAPLELNSYSKACGNISSELFMKIRNSVRLLMDADIDIEFRTTVVPGLHEMEDIASIARYIRGSKRYTLQQFNPENALSINYRDIIPYTREKMEKIRLLCEDYVQDVKLVNM